MQAAQTRLDLPSLLIQPVQRMPRYQLLIRELIKKTPKEHIDYKELEKALEKCTEINVFTNKSKKEYDNKKKLTHIKNILKNNPIVRRWSITHLNLWPNLE